MRGSLIVFSAFLMAAPALATSGVSDRYDGVYSGRAISPPGAPGENRQCPGFTVDEMRIAKGMASSGGIGRARRASASDEPAINGFITEEGFFTGTIVLPGSGRDTIEGRLDDGVLVAGVMDHSSGCSWVLRLHPVS